MAAIMPERLAQTDPYQQVTEMVGSGPFHFLASERVSGARVVYEKFTGYVPRPDGVPSYTSGPKIAHLDRIEWTVVPDPSTSAAALGSGEFDWWENPVIDLVPQLKANRDITVVVKDATRRTRLHAIQPDAAAPSTTRPSGASCYPPSASRTPMDAVAGADPSLVRVPVGLFAAGTPLANDAGLAATNGAADPDKLKAALAAAGYKGERVVILAASDFPTINAMAQVGGGRAEAHRPERRLPGAGLGAPVVQRRASKRRSTRAAGTCSSPPGGAPAISVRPPTSRCARTAQRPGSAGRTSRRWRRCACPGSTRRTWPHSKRSPRALQLQAMQDVPYVPMGMYFSPTAFRKTISGIPDGFPQFYGVKKSA